MKALISLFLCMLFLFVGMPRIRSAPTIEKQSISIIKNQNIPVVVPMLSPCAPEKQQFEGTNIIFADKTYRLQFGKDKTNFFGSSSGGIGYSCSWQTSILYKQPTNEKKDFILPFVRNVTFI